MSLDLSCNLCCERMSGKAFKLHCNHVFCNDCIRKAAAQRRCSMCSHGVNSAEDILEFQIVGGPVLDSQLGDLKSMIMAIAIANGVQFLGDIVSSLHVFEKVQLRTEALLRVEQADKVTAQLKQREDELVDQQLEVKHRLATLEHKCAQLGESLEQSQQQTRNASEQLDDATRQADNWKAMYESVRAGRTGGGGTPASSPIPRASPSPRSGARKQPRSMFVASGLNGRSGGGGSGGYVSDNHMSSGRLGAGYHSDSGLNSNQMGGSKGGGLGEGGSSSAVLFGNSSERGSITSNGIGRSSGGGGGGNDWQTRTPIRANNPGSRTATRMFAARTASPGRGPFGRSNGGGSGAPQTRFGSAGSMPSRQSHHRPVSNSGSLFPNRY